MTATGSWPVYRFGYQFTGSEALGEAYVPFFGAFGAAWDDAMVARWSANPLGMLWRERDAEFVTSGHGGTAGRGAAAGNRKIVWPLWIETACPHAGDGEGWLGRAEPRPSGTSRLNPQRPYDLISVLGGIGT